MVASLVDLAWIIRTPSVVAFFVTAYTILCLVIFRVDRKVFVHTKVFPRLYCLPSSFLLSAGCSCFCMHTPSFQMYVPEQGNNCDSHQHSLGSWNTQIDAWICEYMFAMIRALNRLESLMGWQWETPAPPTNSFTSASFNPPLQICYKSTTKWRIHLVP